MPNWKKLIVSGSDASLNTLSLTNSGSTSDTLILTATEDSSTAAPVATFKRNSSSPADADYLGQLKFQGENDADQEVVYAKITAKIQDASDGSEDGLIEFANKKAGSNNITARLKSDKLQLLNGTELEVDGQVSASSFISNNFSGSFQGDGSSLTNVNTTVSELTTIVDTFTNATTHSVSHLFETKNVNVTVYDNNDDVFIPTRINTPTTESVVVYMDPASSGRVVISKGGHIVSGSIQIESSSTVSDTFSSATTHSVAHTFGTKDVIVSVYDNNDDVFIPTRINTPTTSSVVIYMDPATTGRVVIGKAGHIVSGSTLLDSTGVISGSAQIASNISGSFTATSSSISTRLTTAESELNNTLVSGSAQVVSLLDGQNLNLGEVSASKVHTTIVSSSIAFSSGSNIFGDQLTDVHQVTGSLNVTGSANLVASQSVNDRDSSALNFWAGSQAQYDALGSYNSNTIYFVT